MTTLALLTYAYNVGGLSARYLSSYAKCEGIPNHLLYVQKESRGSFVNPEQGKVKQPQLETLYRYLVDNKIKFLGFSLMTCDFFGFQDTVTFLRSKGWKGIIIAGGVHASLRPDECLFEGVDFVVTGPGEKPLVDIINGRELKFISGLVYRENGIINKNPITKEAVIDLDQLPFPNYDFKDYFLISYEGELLNITQSLYTKMVPARGVYYYLMTSRGCPYRCAYCCNDNRERTRRASVDYVMKELHFIRDQLPFTKGVNVQDDNFFMGSEEWLKEFSERLKRELNWPMIIRITPKFVTPGRMEILKTGGLEYVSIGLQGSSRLNKEYYNRPGNPDDFVKACQLMAELNIIYLIDIIVDVPYETEDDLREMARTLNRLPRPFKIQAYSMTPFPGTPFYERAKKDGLLDKFYADAYRSAFTGTRPDGYHTPDYWKILMQEVIPLYQGPVVDRLIESNEKDEDAVKLLKKIQRRSHIKRYVASYVRSKIPIAFDKVLHVYQRFAYRKAKQVEFN